MERIFDQLGGEIFVAILLLAVFLAASIRRWLEWWRRLRSASWPTIPGVVEGGEVSTHRGRSRYGTNIENATAQLSYSYRLDGNYFAGYHTEVFNDEQKAWSYVDRLKGQPVDVSYNPKKPDVSVLRQPPKTSLDSRE